MNDQSFLFQRKAFSRRNFVRGLGTAGAGLVVGSKLITPALAKEDEGGEREGCRASGLCDNPFPIPHVAANGAHFFFPGKVEGIDADHGRDPSLITDFDGFIGEADLNLSGTGTVGGQSKPYKFHTDMRFLKGVFVGVDGRKHRGAFAFI